jgi:hypothetical protein
MPKRKQDVEDKRLQRTLGTVERTASLIRTEAAQLGDLAKILDHWGGLIRITRVTRGAVIDSEQWVSDIEAAVKEMKQRTLVAARRLRTLIASHEKKRNGTKQ